MDESEMPACAAAVAAPIRKLCLLNKETSRPAEERVWRTAETSICRDKGSPDLSRKSGPGVGGSTTLQHDGGLPSGLQCNALAPVVHFVWVTKWTRDASALHWMPERGLPSFHSRVMFLNFSHSLPCFCTCTFTGPPLFEMKFLQKLFP